RDQRNRLAELADLVIEPADLGLLELEPTQFLGLIDADLADARDRLAAILQRPGLEHLERGVRSPDGIIDRGEDPEIARGSTRGLAVAQDGPVPHLEQHFLDHVADDVFSHLHGGDRLSLFRFFDLGFATWGWIAGPAFELQDRKSQIPDPI